MLASIVTSGDGLGEVDVTSTVALVPDAFTSSSVNLTSAHGSALVPGLSISHVSSVEPSNLAVFVLPVGFNAESFLGLVTEDRHIRTFVCSKGLSFGCSKGGGFFSCGSLSLYSFSVILKGLLGFSSLNLS